MGVYVPFRDYKDNPEYIPISAAGERVPLLVVRSPSSNDHWCSLRWRAASARMDYFESKAGCAGICSVTQ
jgi:hypothetical protein